MTSPKASFPTASTPRWNWIITIPPVRASTAPNLYRLTLDGSGAMQRLTCFAQVPTYRASNPVVSDDGKYMAFQMGRSGVAAGTGWGIFLYDFGGRPKTRLLVRPGPGIHGAPCMGGFCPSRA